MRNNSYRKRLSLPAAVTAAVAIAVVLSSSARAEEGMWLFNQFPKDKVAAKYSVEVTQPLLDHLRLSSVSTGASGSFVSPNGLMFTNHHVVLGCVQDNSSAGHDYVARGFYASTAQEELKCPGAEANTVLGIEDVTAAVKSAVKAAPYSPEAVRERRTAMLHLENACHERTGNNCQVVTLYGGAQYHLYESKKYTDIRLVFAPEYQVGFFGGDPDNFTYPRYCLDIGFLRAYENGAPARTPNYLTWSRDGVKNGDLVLVSGNPARTERLLTVSELEYYRDVTYPAMLKRLESTIAALKAYAALNAENDRAARGRIFGFENTYKAMKGRYSGLLDVRLMAEKKRQESELRAAVDKNAAHHAAYSKVWDQVRDAVKTARATYTRRSLVDAGPAGSTLFSIARSVLRLPEELAKPEDQRLPGFAGGALRAMENRLYSSAPITASMEAVILEDYLRALERGLGSGDPLVKSVLEGKSPAEAAAAYIAGTKLADVAVRKQLAANVEAVRNSADSMLRLARILDPEARRLHKLAEDQIDSVLSAAKPKLAEARFAVYGAGEPPDATGTLRLSYGVVKGYEDSAGHAVPWATRLGGIYQRATGVMPYVLPDSWKAAQKSLRPDTPFDFVSTADIIGGNSGSPTVNANGEIVGIVFDGNIESLPAHFQFTDVQARAVHVASQAILEALDKVYHAGRILEEMGHGSGAKAAAAAGAGDGE